MKNTVVIFNAGIGALTLGFKNAGYEILKAYEPDRKVTEIYQENISQNVTACSLSSIDPVTVPDSNVWAFGLTQSKEEEFGPGAKKTAAGHSFCYEKAIMERGHKGAHFSAARIWIPYHA